MLFSLALPLLSAACATATLLPRQDTSASAAPTTAAGSASATHTVPPTVSFSLASTNPTAVPLSEISFSPATHATEPLHATPAAGATPSGIPNAPPLPALTNIKPTDYPALDAVPPTDSPQVQQWIQEVLNSGIPIPDWEPTKTGGCAANPEIVGNQTRCWWTCGQCTRSTDVTVCPDKLTWGLSFDDGPGFYTPNLLNYLDSVSLKSTFFIVGSRAISRPEMVQAEYISGHQLSVHTWSHTPLTTQTNAQIVAELGWTAKVIQDITGVRPNTMRPPYGDIDDRVRAISLAMGFTPIIWTSVGTDTFDTDDWHIADGSASASQVIANFDKILDLAPTLDNGFIVLAHDIYQQTVDLNIGYILPDALARQPAFKIQPIVQCLGKSPADAYIETNNNATYPPTNAHSSGGSSAGGSSSATGRGPNSSAGAGGSNGALSLDASSVLVSSVLCMGVALLASL